jgi:hypothetical protein
MSKARRLPFYLSSLFVLFLCLPVFAQQSTEKKPDSKTPIAILPLPEMRFHKPKLLLQNALIKAEDFIRINKIKIDEYYLVEAKFSIYGGEKEKQPGWRFWWTHQEMSLGNYVEIFVSMEGKVIRLPSM